MVNAYMLSGRVPKAEIGLFKCQCRNPALFEEDSGGSRTVRRAAIDVNELVNIRRKAVRRRAWFRVLNRVERAIVTLTIRCVERIRSPRLAEIVKAIMIKLKEAMKSQVKRTIETVGRSLAQRLSQVVQAWGNISARRWAKDPSFMQFLAIMYVNTPRMFK